MRQLVDRQRQTGLDIINEGEYTKGGDWLSFTDNRFGGFTPGVRKGPPIVALGKDREELLTFYDFPAEHWIHLRTTNPIESTFATIRLRHRRTKGSGTRNASLTMMFKLAQAAQKRWQRLHGAEQITLILEGRLFVDGVLQDAA